MRSIIIFFLSFVYSFGIAQQNKLYEEKFVNANDISIHYLDFGGSGTPVIFLQSFHDDAHAWVDHTFTGFAPRFTKTNKVYSITRRGWGKSSNPGWGFDVASQAEDVIGFMDALKIDKAIFIGRVPACMDMTFIAEHHPQRVAALVYWNAPHVAYQANDSVYWQYKEMMLRMACDVPLGKSLPRTSWLPHFIHAKPGSIAVPAIYFSFGDVMDKQSVETRFFAWGMMMAKQNPTMICDSTAREYFISLTKNPEKQKAVENGLKDADNRTAMIYEAFKKAFTPAITMIQRTDMAMGQQDPEKYWKEKGSDYLYKHISEFINKIKQ